MYDSSSSDAAAGIFASLFSLGFAGFSFLWTCLYCLIMLLSIAGIVLWIVMLIDVARREEKDFPDSGENQKVIWILVIVLAGAIGAVVYYFLVYKKMQNKAVPVRTVAKKLPKRK